MTAPSVLTVLYCRPDSSAPTGAAIGGGSGPESADPAPAGPGGPGPGAQRPAGRGRTDDQAATDEPKVTAAFERTLAALAAPGTGGTRVDGAGSAGAGVAGSGFDSVVATVIKHVGRRPGKAIDGLLAGRLLVIGDDADLAAVVLRLVRRELLGEVEVAYAAPRRTPFTQLWNLPVGPGAVPLARAGEADLVPLVRDDVGGVLVGAGYLGPLNGTVYVDEKRVLRGAAHRLRVQPDRDKGLTVTVEPRRLAGLGVFARRPKTTLGRAVQIGTVPTAVVRDGIPYARLMDRWTFYKHTEPLRLIRGVF